EALQTHVAAEERTSLFGKAGEEGLSERPDACDRGNAQRQRGEEDAKAGKAAAQFAPRKANGESQITQNASPLENVSLLRDHKRMPGTRQPCGKQQAFEVASAPVSLAREVVAGGGMALRRPTFCAPIFDETPFAYERLKALRLARGSV